MEQNAAVGISEWKVAKVPEVLVTYALGSCVGTCIIDKATGIAGLSHIMLPDSTCAAKAGTVNRMKFADTAIRDMVDKMVKMGALRSRLQAKIIGGALMFATSCDSFNIGERNVAAVREQLAGLNIPIIAAATGGNVGRTVYFHTDSGLVDIKTAGKIADTI